MTPSVEKAMPAGAWRATIGAAASIRRATRVWPSLARVGKLLGYRVTVCDARAAFVTPERFPEADELVVTRIAQPDQLPEMQFRDALAKLDR